MLFLLGQTVDTDGMSQGVPLALGQIAIMCLIKSQTAHHALTRHQRETVIKSKYLLFISKF